MKPLDHSAPSATRQTASALLAWLPGLAAIDTGITPIVGDGSRPLFRHISLSPALRSAAILLDNRLELRVAPADHPFALALVAAFVAPAGRPAAADAASHDLLAMAARVAPKDISILIEGATGTGKEGLARLLHTLSQRRDCPFVAVNCAALPETMLEATLFGHERGAFTGAIAAGQGLFRAAQGGTLFLDEVAELPLALQAKLLRAVQEREVMPVGATVAQPIDVRIIAAATRTDLGGGDFSFSGGSASPIDIAIDASNNSLTGLRDAINRSASGITASIISNADSATLSLRGADGAAQAFIISAAPAVGDPGLARFAYTPGNRALALATTATDADLSVDGVAVRRSSNVIDDLVAGTRITLKKADTAATTRIAAARSAGEIGATLSDFASTLTAMRSVIADFRKGATGSDAAAAAALVNDPTARAIDQRIAGLVTAPFSTANGLRLRDVGLSVGRDGTISYDPARFTALPPGRLADAEALLTALSAPSLSTQPNRLQSIAALTNPANSGLSRQRSAVTSDLAKVDIRLASYRTTLTRQYAAMDRLVAASKAVGEQLDQQIAAWGKRDS